MGFLLQFWPYIAGAVAAVFAGWRLRQTGINAERARQAKEKLAAAEDRLAMDKEATAIERRVSGLTDEQAKKEAMKWSRP
ncbi:hypothetical protein [Mesorhizobium retamae]|uniref:ABC transporter permease n=1 Tax=Mesorhizobium retamae TaxID=2912854 RepID=A0ABS9QIE1_9HYPH|nr:hypothetical protein [Mesorhizobium sp. IRAMC:0171]MCG7507214.1 hypothetical protein [Mesorhizobium sp. IRAMC:0171]